MDEFQKSLNPGQRPREQAQGTRSIEQAKLDQGGPSNSTEEEARNVAKFSFAKFRKAQGDPSKEADVVHQLNEELVKRGATEEFSKTAHTNFQERTLALKHHQLEKKGDHAAAAELLNETRKNPNLNGQRSVDEINRLLQNNNRIKQEAEQEALHGVRAVLKNPDRLKELITALKTDQTELERSPTRENPASKQSANRTQNPGRAPSPG